jgi:hypothetical protein
VIIFGSYVTAKGEPRDIDIILIMKDDFDVETCSPSIRPLFDHSQADHRFGASIFWIRPAMLLLAESVDSFIARWQFKRDGGNEASWRLCCDRQRPGVECHPGADRVL